MKRWVASLGVVLVAASSAGCRAGQADEASRMLAIDGFVLPVRDRGVTPDLTGTTLTGGRFDVRDWRGHVVVVNFWGSWCAPCHKEAPQLQRVAEETYSRGVRFLGIDIKDNRASARAFVAQHKLSYPSLFDPSDNQALAFRPVTPPTTPVTYVLDQQGRVAARYIGATEYRPLRATVDLLLFQG